MYRGKIYGSKTVCEEMQDVRESILTFPRTSYFTYFDRTSTVPLLTHGSED